jgi:hypothetical protein
MLEEPAISIFRVEVSPAAKSILYREGKVGTVAMNKPVAINDT